MSVHPYTVTKHSGHGWIVRLGPPVYDEGYGPLVAGPTGALADVWPETVPCWVELPKVGEVYSIAVSSVYRDTYSVLRGAMAGLADVVAPFTVEKLREYGYAVEDVQRAIELAHPLARRGVLDGFLPGFLDHAVQCLREWSRHGDRSRPDDRYIEVMRWRP